MSGIYQICSNFILSLNIICMLLDSMYAHRVKHPEFLGGPFLGKTTHHRFQNDEKQVFFIILMSYDEFFD